MATLKDNIEKSQDDLNDLLIKTGDDADNIYKKLDDSANGIGTKLTTDEEDELQEQLIKTGDSADAIYENIIQLDEMLTIVKAITPTTGTPISQHVLTTQKVEAEKLKKDIIAKYATLLESLDDELGKLDLIKLGFINIKGWADKLKTDNVKCGTKDCYAILELINKDKDFKELAKTNPKITSLQTKLTTDMQIQAGGFNQLNQSEWHKSHQKKDLIFW